MKEALLHVPYNNFFDFIDLAASTGAADLEIIYSTDSWHQTFGELMQSYIDLLTFT